MTLHMLVLVLSGDFDWDQWTEVVSDEQPSHYHSQTSLDSEGVSVSVCTMYMFMWQFSSTQYKYLREEISL